MKKFIYLFVSIICLNIQGFAQFEDFGKILKNVDVPSPKAKEWTVAIYINGRNNVDMFAYTDFNRIETQGSDSNVNIVAELGRSQGFLPDESTPEVWSGVRRYYVKKDSDLNKINSDMIVDRGSVDMGSWEEAADFVRWAKINYPSKKFMFIIWDHGWGWIDPVIDSVNQVSRSISHDFTTNNYIKTTDIKKIFKKAGSVDMYASMACFMQMAEVVSEIKDYAKVIVGSEEVIQLPSFNWEDFLGLLKKYPDSDAEKAGIFLVDTFKEMYQRPEYFKLLVDGQYGTQLSAIRASEMDKFISSIKKIGDIVMKIKDVNAISKAKRDVLRFEVGEVSNDPDKLISFYGDIYNFLELIDKNYSNKSDPVYLEFSRELNNFKRIINGKLVIKNVYLNKDRTNKDFSNTHGISMYIPGAKGELINYYDTYTKLEFDKLTGWSRVIKFLDEQQ